MQTLNTPIYNITQNISKYNYIIHVEYNPMLALTMNPHIILKID